VRAGALGAIDSAGADFKVYSDIGASAGTGPNCMLFAGIKTDGLSGTGTLNIKLQTVNANDVNSGTFAAKIGKSPLSVAGTVVKGVAKVEISVELLSNVVDGGERKVVYPWCRERHHSPDRAGGYTTWESLRLSSWLVQESRATC
jgi:hypothetical protein